MSEQITVQDQAQFKADSVEVTQAVKTATEYFTKLMKETGEPIANPRLEEVELNKDLWAITISYNRVDNINSTLENSLAAFYGNHDKREYKVINIDTNTGKVLSMKMRDVVV